ncbi:MAG: hypothetical protein LKI93_04895 [Bifidobacteriaceae bacterium]|jgi:hypothetical protein|nr:hypothetical protein [Bifidobacteriaceae bacterium]MCI1914388.1 hypothetical protein [Bifidobacteriaceae bacterium]MCI1935840.1 hypothetical protein [Bifidobacteriaceae bacterium]
MNSTNRHRWSLLLFSLRWLAFFGPIFAVAGLLKLVFFLFGVSVSYWLALLMAPVIGLIVLLPWMVWEIAHAEGGSQ